MVATDERHIANKYNGNTYLEFVGPRDTAVSVRKYFRNSPIDARIVYGNVNSA